MFRPSGETVLVDYGLAHHRDLPDLLQEEFRVPYGTAPYMAPERLRNPGDVDARADIYSLGAVAFFLLSGRKLLESEDDLVLTSKILNEEPPRVAKVAPQKIPAELDLLVEHIHERSGGQSRQATGASASNLDLYQVNCTYFDACGRDAEAYLAARAIQRVQGSQRT